MKVAWHTAALVKWNTDTKRGGKAFPKIDRLMIAGRKPKAPQTPEQMLQIAKMLTVAFGGTIVKRNKEG